MQRTLAMIKPDAVAKAGAAQAIMAKIAAAGFTITRRRHYTLYPAQAEEFYAEHANKPFFSKLMDFMTSGPIWAFELQVCLCVDPALQEMVGDFIASPGRSDCSCRVQMPYKPGAS
jgi:nucleoside diphosphate kinase